MTPQQLSRRLSHWLRYPFSRRRRIETKMLTGRLTINEGRAMLGLRPFTGPPEHLADRHIKVDQRGVWVLQKG